LNRFKIPVLVLASVLAVQAQAGRFQVGAYRKDFDVDRETGYPSDLMAPAQRDTVWLAAARSVLLEPGNLTHQLILGLMSGTEASAWLDSAGMALDDLEDGAEILMDPSEFLAASRAAWRVFSRLDKGDLENAAEAAVWIRVHSVALGLLPREAFLWHRRAQYLNSLTDPEPIGPTGPWPGMLELAPWDAGNAWAMWQAQCQHFLSNLLPEHVTGKEWATFLAGRSNTGITPAGLAESALEPDLQLGLGGVLFKGSDLIEHLVQHPDPPNDFSAQGWWVRGQRTRVKGRAQSYEKIAGNARLSAGWRMDVWRRASERRLLLDHWEHGLQDLKVALTLAGEGRGTSSLRRRLRQWAEQALVLALAQGRTETALEIRQFGLDHLKDDEREAFLAEVGHWDPQLSLGEIDDPLDLATLDRATLLVSRGASPELQPNDDEKRQRFQTAAKKDLWDLWITWGLTLANPEPVTGDVRARAIRYGEALEAARNAEAEGRLGAVMATVALRFAGRGEAEEILRQAFHFDVAARTGGQSPARPSGVPALERHLRGSELDRHALLGLALAAGDMRGILGVAVNLPGRGLTAEEKLRFLYPLPGDGVIRDAILEADSEPALLLAVARNESLFEPTVRSRAGALGWMQIMPFHYEGLGARPGPANWSNPALSIQRGDGLLVENRRRYDGDPYRAVAAYNAGPEAASRWERQLGHTQTRAMYLAWIGYPETRHYVEKVLIDREIYDWIIGGLRTK